MRACPLWLCSLALVACSHSRSGNDETLLASATIGPEGGTIEVVGGAQNGLQLQIPPGALREPTVIRIRDLDGIPARQPEPASVPVGQPFQLEPDELRLDELAILRAPYSPGTVAGTSPGNVRMRQVRSTVVI